VSRKTPRHFLNNWVKNEPIWTILVHEMWKKFDISTFAFVHLTCKMYRLHGCLWFKFLDDITASYFSKLSNFGGELYNFDLVKSSAFHKVVCGDILCMVWWTSVKRLMSISSGFSLCTNKLLKSVHFRLELYKKQREGGVILRYSVCWFCISKS